MNTSIYAASVDSLEKTQEVAEPLSFPVAWGVDRDTGNKLGAFWEERRDHIQPSEFVVTRKGRILSSTYSSSPVGRTDPEEVLKMLKYIVAMKK